MPKEPRTDCHFIEDILAAIGKIERYVGDADFENFNANDMAKDAIIRNFEIIGEAARNIYTALLYAVSNGYFEIVKVLLRNNAAVNVAELSNGLSPLMIATMYQYDRIVEELLKYGADVRYKANNGITAPMIAHRLNNDKLINILTKANTN